MFGRATFQARVSFRAVKVVSFRVPHCMFFGPVSREFFHEL